MIRRSCLRTIKFGLTLALALVFTGASAPSPDFQSRSRRQGFAPGDNQRAAFTAHFFTATTVLAYTAVKNTAQRCRGVFNEPGIGTYNFTVPQARNDSELTCMYIAEAVGNDRLVGGFINEDQTVNFIEVEAGASSSSTEQGIGQRGSDGVVESSGSGPLDAFPSHAFSGTTVEQVNTVSNKPRRCNGVLNEPGIGSYLFIVNESTEDSKLSCLNLAEAKANDKLVRGTVNADQTVNVVGIEP